MKRRTSPESSPSLFEGTRAPIAPPPPREEALDAFPGASPRSAIAVSTLTQTAKDIVEGAFPPIWVRGEVCDFKSHRNGHWYFGLRDRASQIRCVVWSRDQRGIPAAPDDGMQVTAFGQLGVYPARGEIQFSVRRMEATGDGLRRKALEATRQRLDAEGFFAPERKRSLPRHPRRIAMITSTSGAALRDVIAVLKKRAPGVELIVVHAAVQGDSAPLELCHAIARVARWGGAEVVIIGRGGGSSEDLWAFNDERVVRALAACPVPTISAVGHEVDISLCDLVADHRAPTPSAAAEAAVTSRTEMSGALRALRRRMVHAIDARVYERTFRARSAAHDLDAATSDAIRSRSQRLGALSGRLHALSPLATLDRGYGVARDARGTTLASAADFAAGLPFVLRVRDGDIDAVVTGVRSIPESA